MESLGSFQDEMALTICHFIEVHKQIWSSPYFCNLKGVFTQPDCNWVEVILVLFNAPSTPVNFFFSSRMWVFRMWWDLARGLGEMDGHCRSDWIWISPQNTWQTHGVWWSAESPPVPAGHVCWFLCKDVTNGITKQDVMTQLQSNFLSVWPLKRYKRDSNLRFPREHHSYNPLANH